MHVIGRIACALSLALILPAQAQDRQQDQPQRDSSQSQQPSQSQQAGVERLEVDTNLICDTQQQVERFVSLLDENGGSAEAAIATVNAENKSPDACLIATIAYRRAGITGEAKNATATFDVLRIIVTGIYTVNGLELAVPTELFTIMPKDTNGNTIGQSPGGQAPAQGPNSQNPDSQGSTGQGPGNQDPALQRPDQGPADQAPGGQDQR